MKQFRTYALLLIFCTLLMRPLAPVLGYALNKGFIASALCINQDRPEMKCDGKCYLKLQLEEQEDKSPTPAESTVQQELQPFVASPQIRVAEKDQRTPTRTANSDLHPFAISQEIFHPPRS